MEMSKAVKVADLVDKCHKARDFAQCIEYASIFGITITVTGERYDENYDKTEPFSCTINTNDLFNDKHNNIDEIERVLRSIKALCEKRSMEIGREIKEI